MGTRGGAACLEEGRFAGLTSGDGLVNDQVTAICQDWAGDLWFGTFAGLSQYSGSFTSLRAEDGLAHSDLRAILQDRRGRLWFGTLGGLSSFRDGQWSSYTPAQGLPYQRIFALAEDGEGRVWIGAEGGLSCFDGEGFTHYTPAEGLAGSRVYCLCQARDGRLWIGTTDGGVSAFDGRRFTNYTAAEGLGADDINAILEDRQGRIWFATDGGGLSCWDGTAFTTYTEAGHLPSNQVMGLAQDGAGRLWVATMSGACCLEEGRFTRYAAEQGLPSDQVLRVFCDRLGYVWFSTWSGVSCYDGAVFQTLDRRDGLAGNTAMTFAEDLEGGLWIGTSAGATCYRRPAPSPPPVYIQAVVADRRYAEVRQLSIPSSAGLVAFEFHSINFKTRPGAMLYRYRLQGLDAQWRTTHARRLEYQGLEPGSYLFQVTAVDRDLNYSMPVAVQVEVVPDARDARIDELETRVRERTRQLEEKNAALEDTLRQLRQTQHQLIVQEKMATLGALVAGIVHELNSPLATIRSSADVARRSLDKLRRIAGETSNPEQVQALLHRVLEPVAQDNQALTQAVARLGRIVGSLKSFAQLDRAEYQRADVHEGLESAFTLLEYQLKGRIRLVRQYGQLPPIQCAPGELNQVFMSVLRNAVQAIAAEGEIRVRTYRDGAWVHIEIADTGRGIPRERLQRIFDPVLSHKEERVGMGMGLSLSYSIVAQHQGRIEVESEPGRGTVVTISLPIGAL